MDVELNKLKKCKFFQGYVKYKGEKISIADYLIIANTQNDQEEIQDQDEYMGMGIKHKEKKRSRNENWNNQSRQLPQKQAIKQAWARKQHTKKMLQILKIVELESQVAQVVLQIYKLNYKLYQKKHQQKSLLQKQESEDLKIFFKVYQNYDISAIFAFGDKTLVRYEIESLKYLFNPQGDQQAEFIDIIDEIYYKYLQQEYFVVRIQEEDQIEQATCLVNSKHDKFKNIYKIYFMIDKLDESQQQQDGRNQIVYRFKVLLEHGEFRNGDISQLFRNKQEYEEELQIYQRLKLNLRRQLLKIYPLARNLIFPKKAIE